MTTFIALLRGINVTGRKIVRMEQLRASFEALGFRKVQTYVQSGNVVFEAARASGLAKKIEEKIADDFGFPVPVLLRTTGELATVIKRNPFLKDEDVDQSKLHVTFLSDDPPKTATALLQPLAADSERFQVIGREIYLYCPEGYGRTRLSNAAIEKKLSVGATTRNWKTTNALLAMAQ